MPLTATGVGNPPTPVGQLFPTRIAGLAPRVRLVHMLALALACRLVMLTVPGLAHPDEVYQYLEPAHRLLFGSGVVTWEWRYGMRSWTIPLIVAPFMWLGEAVAPGTGLYLLLPHLAMTLASLGIVAVAWQLGKRLSHTHAIAAAAATALCHDLIFFSTHILSETVSLSLILPAAFILISRETWTDRRLAVAGALLALALAARFQHAPAVLALVVASQGRDISGNVPALMAGGLAALLPIAIIDIAMGGMPFAWLFENIRQNFVADRASEFGVSGPLGFLWEIWPYWSLWLLPLLAAAVIGARRYPALMWAAAANLLFHSAIAHKEYRFILLSMTIVLILAAIGTVDRVAQIGAAHGEDQARKRARLFLFCWAAAFISLSFGNIRHQWTAAGSELTLFDRLRQEPGLCGIALYRQDVFRSGGYARLHRDIPMNLYVDFEMDGAPNPLRADQSRFNVIVAKPTYANHLPSNYVQGQCTGEGKERACFYRRPGSCHDAGAGRFDIQNVLLRFDR